MIYLYFECVIEMQTMEYHVTEKVKSLKHDTIFTNVKQFMWHTHHMTINLSTHRVYLFMHIKTYH